MLSPRSQESFKKVNNAVTQSLKVTVEQLCSKIRTADIIDAKFVAWYILHTRYRRAFVIIGEMYSKHYTTIISAVRKTQKGKKPRVLVIAEQIESILNENEKIKRV